MSEIKVDTLTGKTTANDITVTVGATATQSLQQGLAKAWGEFDGSAGTISYGDSFNCASLTDNGTSDYSSARTNNMGNALYAVFGTSGKSTTSERNFNIPDGQFPNTTSSFRMQITTSDGALASDQATFISFGSLGDLA
jgi:hypothetical protein